jgi:hypothetical protein
LTKKRGLAQYYDYPDGAVARQGEKPQQLQNKYPNSSHAASMKKALAAYARQKARNEETKKAKDNPQQQR